MPPVTLTPDQIRAFLQHLHFIPVSRGYTELWMDLYAPGWTTADLVVALRRAGAIKRGGTHFSRHRVVAVEAMTLPEQ